MIGVNAQIHWYCATCNLGIGDVIIQVNKLRDNINKQEEKSDLINSKVDKVCSNMIEMQGFQRKVDENFVKVVDQIQELKKQIESIDNKRTALEDKLEVKELTKAFLKDESWSDVVKREVVNNLQNMKENISEIGKVAEQTRTQVEEVQDKELRRKNVIIYRVEESDAQLFNDRLRHDTDLVNEMINYVTVIDSNDIKLTKIIRLGKRESDKTRPLLIQFDEMMQKNLLMQGTYKLKDAPAKLKAMIVTHDLTSGEREECKRLVQEAKDKEEHDVSGEWVYRVRGSPGKMRIVRWRRN